MTKKFLLINPNTSEETTRKLSLHLQPFLPTGFDLDVRTVSKGAPYIACEASHAVAASALLETWADYLCEQQAPDGVLIGCFGDPGLFALRESSACKVTGLAEAAFMHAAANVLNDYHDALNGADDANTRGISTLSHMAGHPALKLGLSNEFIGRADGWQGLAQRYSLRQVPTGLDHGLAYEALGAKQVDVIDIYSTDAKIARYGLRVLQDDRSYFPKY